MKFGGINLWNLPKQPSYELQIKAIQRIKELAEKMNAIDEVGLQINKQKVQQLEELIKAQNFILYTRTGRFVE